MYIESIADNEDLFRMERQKNTPDGGWYGVSLVVGQTPKFQLHDILISDNDDYIIGSLYYSLRDNPREASKELELPLKKEDIKILLKLIKKADKLGWFDHLKKQWPLES